MKIFVIGVIIVFIVIILKVFYIQVFEYDKLNNLAHDLWSRNLPIEADRGKIYDRNGVVLADNITTTSLVLIPNQIKDKKTTTEKLAKILNVSYDAMKEHVYKNTSIERVHPFGRRLAYSVAEQIEKLKLEGVYLVRESKRSYPYGKELSHTLGFVGIDNQGLSGIELQYDDYLTGEYGAIKYFSDAKGNKLNLSQVYESPQNGVNVTLTVNQKIQASVERELNNVVTKYNPETALAIAMDPNSGEILAISSRPNFEAVNYKDYDIETLNRNLPIWATYEPGSTFKIITLAAALNEGLVNLDKDTFYDGGSVRVANAKIKCWKAGGHGFQTFLQVVENSCNPGFVELGNRLGKEKLFDYIDKFGFGKKTGIDLNGEASGIIFNLDKVGPVELATTAFGQGVSVTPIQQITAVSAAINGGILYKPYIVKSLNDPETNSVIKENNPTKVRRVIKEETSKEVRRALESVVTNGSGRNAYIEGYRVGGKTGTAQKVKDGVYMVGNYILSFMGFLPADDPQIVVYVAINNPKRVVQYGGVVSAPIAKSILTDAIDALNIERRMVSTEKKYNWDDKKYYTVENVVGKTPKEASSILSKYTIEYSGSGNIIVEQSPKAGTRLEETSTVRLMLGN
ncbi:MAG: stage V sporulation protein D [Bacilli bacterium]|nr:stage V sporulation protein D [Bacilli bacterium]